VYYEEYHALPIVRSKVNIDLTIEKVMTDEVGNGLHMGMRGSRTGRVGLTSAGRCPWRTVIGEYLPGK